LLGTRIEDYQAPLVVAWQLTNRCTANCVACCEDSGPDRAWRDELTRAEAKQLSQRIVDARIPYVAFGGGEPLGVPHCWELFECFAAAGIGLKLETDARYIDAAAADRLAALPVQCVQISVDGACADTHEHVRPGSDFAAAIGAIERLVARGRAPQLVFVPTRLNLHEIIATYDLAERLGCEAFVTGPLMRLGRAAMSWDSLACSAEDWTRSAHALQEHALTRGSRMSLAIYPWDILVEMERRLASPQAMLLVVPNGMVKLMNALPFVVANLRRDTVSQAWQAYRRAWASREVSKFVLACRSAPNLLSHANETWPLTSSRPVPPER
jgi:MoaA/NifB/PqqE/SkfB family radical SAM enzyme